MSPSERADPAKSQSPPEAPPTAKQDKTEANDTPLALAKRLLEAGIPVVVCHPCPGYGRPGACRWHPEGNAELHFPSGWATITAAECDLSGFRPGIDVLAMVSGHGLDLVDVDTKAGGSVDHLPPFKSYGITRTPSDGQHYVVPSSGLGKVSPFNTGVGHVGDYVGGKPDGSGRLLGYLPGSTRPKYPGGSYTEEVEWDIEACLAADPDPALVEALKAAGADDTVVEEYIDDSPVRPVEDGVHPEAVKGVRRALDRLDALPEVWSDGDHWDENHHKVACILLRYANSNWSGYTMADAEADYRAHARTDEGWGEGKVDEKWRAAQSTVRGGGMAPPYREFADEPLPGAIPPRLSDDREWFINTVMPTKAYGLLSGPIGAGKSSVLGYVVSVLTKEGFRVRYCVEDEPVVSARHRLELLGANMELVAFDTVPDLTTEADIERYARGCAADGTDLVVFDLLQTANTLYEENRPEKVKQWTAQLVERFCNKYGVGVLGTHHWNNNTKAGSAMARLSGAGAIAAKTEFAWSVAISNDKTEQVWSVAARRRCSPWNVEMQGTRHVVEVLQNPFNPSETVERDVYTVQYGDLTNRTSFDVARDAEREFAAGTKRPTSRELVPADALQRFLDPHDPKFPGKHRKRAEVEEFIYWVTGEVYSSPQTVVDRLRDVGAIQCSPDGVPVEDGKGRYWVVLSEFYE